MCISVFVAVFNNAYCLLGNLMPNFSLFINRVCVCWPGHSDQMWQAENKNCMLVGLGGGGGGGELIFVYIIESIVNFVMLMTPPGQYLWCVNVYLAF